MKSTIIAQLVAFTLAPLALNASAEPPTFQMGQMLSEAQNTCIVRFDDSISKFDVEGRTRGMLVASNAQAKHIYKHSIKGFAVNMPCVKAQDVFGDDPDIVSFEQDSLIFALAPPPGKGKNKDDSGDPPEETSQTTPWGITRVGGPVNGSGQVAWIIDTGIDLNHPDLNVDANNGFSAFSSGRDSSPNDGHGHGTHVAGTVAALDNNRDVVGVAAGATVVPVKVLNRRGSGTTSGVIAGVDHVAANAGSGHCANMSLGGGASASLDAAVIRLAETGVLVSLAAGNSSNRADTSSPARANHANIYTISATDRNDVFAYFSNYGNPPVDYAAPGVSVLSTRAGGGTVTYSGTSMAAPHACGVLLMMNSAPPATSGSASGDPDGNPDPIIHL
ncbi:peptidase S8/S53 subtilisin kexin sedolisin [Vibrio orientalis CIP 102891 = ATCC 33934]|uniref:Peptidase S8 and S53 subtilisin kexin sedolisin n=1 Tax=Vibrio orientalis CIP 102891 = ATCC 33934 TaxID=675816 RepID=C9QEN9_VIBOR|nr:S8 family serine peptidase [Vibrio orientalis]EEX94512.1 peptidase S8 and S53 subtilisin kexin sedolisin [Vibrio orientalis CIP 102891 = ATCC 33934]EGU53936.1 peptidase S8/S53 subtilisin kexin sedolisin [Vibrio orientalis CIP 102891 = ATCC 33934]